MKRISVFALLLAAMAVPAAAGTRVVMSTRALPNLPAGTRVHVEMTAEYSVLQPPEAKAPKAGAGPTQIEVTDDMIKYRLASGDRMVWSFVVPADGKVAAQTFTFDFPKVLPAAPAGMAAGITFPTHYRIIMPGEKGSVTVERRSEFGMAYDKPAALITRCAKIGGATPKAAGMGVLPNCDVDPRKLPGAKVLPQ